MVQASILVEIHVKICLIGGDALTEKLIGKTAHSAALGLNGTREKSKAQGEANDEERNIPKIPADVARTLPWHTIP